MRLVKFGAGAREYVFPAAQSVLQGNFPRRTVRVERLPGADGGLDVFGTGRAPGETGALVARFGVMTDSRDDMEAQRDAIKAMASWGTRRLVAQPSDPDLPVRRARARVVDADVAEDHDRHTDLLQRVSVTFQMADPRWYSREGLLYLDDGHLMDDGLMMVGAAARSAGNGDVLTVTNGGTAAVMPLITIGAGSAVWSEGNPYALGLADLFLVELAGAVPVRGVGLRQMGDDGRVRGEWFWAGTLEAGEALVLDGAAMAVRHASAAGDTSAWGAFFATRGFALPALEPGDNRFEVFGTFTGDVEVTFEYDDGWL